MSCVGFDVGNGSCCKVAATKQGEVQILLCDEPKKETPLLVSFTDDKRRTGSEGGVVALALDNPTAVASHIKRLVGKQFSWLEVEEEVDDLPFTTGEADDGGVLIHANRGGGKLVELSPVNVLAVLLSNLRERVERTLHRPISHCTIGVPSYFADVERTAYLEAAEMAGLRGVQLIHDGTAVALGYGFHKTTTTAAATYHCSYVVFVDVGHCDTQVTVSSFEGEALHVLSHASDENLGGRDFDKVLFCYLSEMFKSKHKIDVGRSRRARAKLMEACEKVKNALASDEEGRIELDGEVVVLSGAVTREELEKRSSHLLRRLIDPCARAMRDARLSEFQAYSVELVGSACRIPAISRVLEGHFRRPIGRTLNADECVARGCALRAAALAEDSTRTPYKVHDVIPFAIACKIDDGSSDVIHRSILFNKGILFPHTASFEFPRINEKMLQLDIFPLKADDSSATSHQTTRRFEVGGPNHDPLPKVAAVKVGINVHGVVVVESARLISDRRQVHGEMIGAQKMVSDVLQVSDYSLGMAKSNFTKPQELENQLGNQDKLVEEAQHTRHALKTYVLETRKKLIEGPYQSFASESEKLQILVSLDHTEKWLEDGYEEPQAYHGRLDELTKHFHPIKERYDNNEACIQAKNELEDRIEKEQTLAVSMATDKGNAIFVECKKAGEWLGALKRLMDKAPKCTPHQYQLSNEIKEKTNAFAFLCSKLKTRSCQTIENCSSRSNGPQACTSNAQLTPVSEEKNLDHLLQCTNVVNPFDFVGKFKKTFELYRNNKAMSGISPRKPNKCGHWIKPKSGQYTKEDTKVGGTLSNGRKPSTIKKYQGENSRGSKKMLVETRNKSAASCPNNNEEVQRPPYRDIKERRYEIEAPVFNIEKELLERYGTFISALEKDIIKKALQDLIEWLCKENNEKSEEIYVTKIEHLKKIIDPIEDRRNEHEVRNAAVYDFLYCIFQHRVAVISSQNLHHKDSVNETCNHAEAWLIKRLTEQDLLPKDANPVLRTFEIQQKKNHLNESCQKIVQANSLHVEINQLNVGENELEDYISQTRYKLATIYEGYIKDVENVVISAKIKQIEMMLRGGRYWEPKEFHSRKDELKKLIDAVEKRYKDKNTWDKAKTEFQNQIFRYRELANSLSFPQKRKLTRESDTAEKWLNEKVEEQNQLAKCSDQKLSPMEIFEKKEELEKYYQTLTQANSAASRTNKLTVTMRQTKQNEDVRKPPVSKCKPSVSQVTGSRRDSSHRKIAEEKNRFQRRMSFYI